MAVSPPASHLPWGTQDLRSREYPRVTQNSIMATIGRLLSSDLESRESSTPRGLECWFCVRGIVFLPVLLFGIDDRIL